MTDEVTRVFIDTQSNDIFRGEESEQSYDQRGGLCQVGAGHVVVTTNPYDPAYLAYWEGLGFDLPTLVTAGPFEQRYTLAELVSYKPTVREEIKKAVGDRTARVELFWIEPSDAKLAEALELPLYANVPLSVHLANKYNFKLFADEIGLQTVKWAGGMDYDTFYTDCVNTFASNTKLVVKAANSVGGVELGGMVVCESLRDMCADPTPLSALQYPLIAEPFMDVAKELSVHWEMKSSGPELIGIYDQMADNMSYSGVSMPSRISAMLRERVYEDLRTIFWPALAEQQAFGFYCCDVLVTPDDMLYWNDFNPRKGAVIYIDDVVRRLWNIHAFPAGATHHVWHKHISIPSGGDFNELLDRIIIDPAYLSPRADGTFVFFTNPGAVPFGGIDVAALSWESFADAAEIVSHIEEQLRS